jgi:hypothetical protein
MTTEQYLTILPYKNILFQNNKLTNEAKQVIYQIYNEVYNEQKKPNSCSACLRSVMDRVKIAFNNYETLNGDSANLA